MRSVHLASARAHLAASPGVALVAQSAVEETDPLGGLDQPAYLNQMLLIDVSIGPFDLLDLCQLIERAAGRERHERWSSRTLDLDVVRYGDLLCDLPGLSLPHPGLRDREFWASQIAAVEQDD